MKVEPHSNVKHRAIGCYFEICRNVLKGKSGPDPPIYYIDLYAGDGICESEEAPREKWKPPYYSLIRKLERDNLDYRCVFSDKKQRRTKMLEKRLEAEGFDLDKIEFYYGDANKISEGFLSKIPTYKWSIFFLDPQRHHQLKFSTIEKIAEHSYDGRSGERRPELIINFMVFSILQNYKSTEKANISNNKKERLLNRIDKSLGTSNWREKVSAWQDSKRKKGKMKKIFHDSFLNQLGELGYETISFPVKQTDRDTTIYYLVWATSNESAYNIISKKFWPYLKKQQRNWKRKNYRVRRRKRAERNHKYLLSDLD